MRGKGNEGMEPEDVKMTGVEGSGKKVNGRRERDKDIERREAKAETQRVRVLAGTALEDRAPAEKRGRQPRGSEDVGGRAEIKGLARPEKATPDAKVQKFFIATLEGEAVSDTVIRQGSLPQRAPDVNGAGASRVPGGVQRGGSRKSRGEKGKKGGGATFPVCSFFLASSRRSVTPVAPPQRTQALDEDLVSDSDSNFGGSILDEGPVALLGSLPPPLSQPEALFLLSFSSLGSRRQRKGRGFGWDTPPNKRYSTAGEMDKEKEEGEVVEAEVEGEYVYSVEEGGWSLLAPKRLQKSRKSRRKKEGEKDMTFLKSRGRSGQETDLPPPLPPRPLSQAREMVRSRERGEKEGIEGAVRLRPMREILSIRVGGYLRNLSLTCSIGFASSIVGMPQEGGVKGVVGVCKEACITRQSCPLGR
uniref:Uncharacterized protein n=1 Tax=Chromera velia CCMP2878 TaxID=1169474 RepID=A0A0G4GUY6_9ALVE|eukprot:Cvel_23473.t1-p1 / transcript=Cvel_23473.t1 / gene=Cvel_23473 / organism=Chromera_velia_CCMP2878 / gene_product=hypothetical protein / transcript_product=hypothetical protein / location=Cvel_scaffold2422:21130-28320(-) / protein_length=417 / sequence_SO=supercontig / SO=protein_coding / is_pseudo=false